MQSFEDAIAEHSNNALPNEACGLVLRDRRGVVRTVPTENVAEDPRSFFEISPADYLAAVKGQDDLIGYYHSHPRDSAEPSEADKHAANSAGLPLYIFSVPEAVLGCYVPDGYRQPLEGRRFVPMVFDCVTLVWDYLASRGTHLPLLPRTRRSYTQGVPYDWTPWLEQFQGNVVPAPPREGDILVMMINGSHKPNHLGVFLGDGIFLHQTGDTPSRREVWVGQWQADTALIVRFPPPPADPAP